MQRRLPPRKSDGDGAPSLPWGNERAAARVGAAAPRQSKEGTPCRRSPKAQERTRCLLDAKAGSAARSEGNGRLDSAGSSERSHHGIIFCPGFLPAAAVGFAVVSTSTAFARLVAIFPHLTAFAPLSTGIAGAVVLAVVKIVGADFVVHFPVAGVVYSVVPDAIIAVAALPVSPAIPHIRPPRAVIGAAIPAWSAPGPTERPIEPSTRVAEVDIDIFPGAAAAAGGASP